MFEIVLGTRATECMTASDDSCGYCKLFSANGAGGRVSRHRKKLEEGRSGSAAIGKVISTGLIK